MTENLKFLHFQKYAVYLLGIFFIGAGFAHFLVPSFYVNIMPDYLPAHLMLVYISGVFEMIGGLGVLIKSVRKLAGMGLILLLLAVFPANIHMALHPELYPSLPSWGLYIRLPIQLVLLAWAYLAVYEIKNLNDSNN
ncbi:MAG: hypothetical protein COA79_15880 [Planctomycetota bacterium]|nr:MAG: hypothetical protein COA79_15880 [Planctomycetota bacterium]